MSLQTILSVAESKKFYVYLHLRKDTNKPFYVGKGCGQRAYAKHGRNKHWKAVVNKHGYDVKIIQENLTETQALNAEKFTISILSNYSKLTNSSFGGGGVDYAPYVEFGTGPFAKSYLASMPKEIKSYAMTFFVNGQGRTEAQPFLIPAYLKYRKQFFKDMKDIAKIISK